MLATFIASLFTYRKVGGLHFVRIGAFTFMACRRRHRPL
jgi:hypothetical protein